MKRILSLSTMLFVLTVNAQNDIDALRYSMSSLAGTARYISMGGAFGALGADMSAISTNPGGIGVYRKSELALSPSFYVGRTNSSYFGNESFDTRYNMNFGNGGMIFTYKLSNNDSSMGWKNWNFGIVYNRLDNYQSRSLFEGFNPSNSLLDVYLQNANSNGGLDPEQLNQFYEYQAFYTYLIDTSSGSYFSAVPNGNILQRRSSTAKGARGETLISFGGNYSNKLFLGANIGIASLRYVENTVYEERDEDNIYDTSSTYFDSFTFSQDITSRGYGINFKFGLIYKPMDPVRIGMAIHSPTFYSVHDEYINATKSYFDDGSTYSIQSDLGEFDYELRTPFRVIGSLGFVIGKSGIVSGDFEFVDYSDADLNSDVYKFFDENTAIRTKYTTSQNIRLGTEWVYGGLSFRGGYAMFGSPFSSTYKESAGDLSKSSYCFGIGIRDRGYFIDFGYVLSKTKYLLLPYVYGNESPVSENKLKSHNFTMTLGVKF